MVGCYVFVMTDDGGLIYSALTSCNARIFHMKSSPLVQISKVLDAQMTWTYSSRSSP